MQKTELFISKSKNVTQYYKKKWKSIYDIVKNDIDKNLLILLAEILEILDSNNKCEFICKKYEGPGMYGGYNYEWILKTKKLKIHKKLVCEISDSWQRVEVEEEFLKITGFTEFFKLEWNGNTDDNSGVNLFLFGVDDKNLIKIKIIADKLYENVELIDPQNLPKESNFHFQKEIETHEKIIETTNFYSFNFNSWEFYITKTPNNNRYFNIPDCGGMADSETKSRDQLEWCILNFKDIPDFVQVWETSWEIISIYLITVR